MTTAETLARVLADAEGVARLAEAATKRAASIRDGEIGATVLGHLAVRGYEEDAAIIRQVARHAAAGARLCQDALAADDLADDDTDFRHMVRRIVAVYLAECGEGS